MFCCVMRCVLSSFAVILMGCFTLFVFLCLVIGIVLCSSSWVWGDGQRCVVVVFPDYTHLLFFNKQKLFVKECLILNK